MLHSPSCSNAQIHLIKVGELGACLKDKQLCSCLLLLLLQHIADCVFSLLRCEFFVWIWKVHTLPKKCPMLFSTGNWFFPKWLDFSLPAAMYSLCSSEMTPEWAVAIGHWRFSLPEINIVSIEHVQWSYIGRRFTSNQSNTGWALSTLKALFLSSLLAVSSLSLFIDNMKEYIHLQCAPPCSYV